MQNREWNGLLQEGVDGRYENFTCFGVTGLPGPCQPRRYRAAIRVKTRKNTDVEGGKDMNGIHRLEKGERRFEGKSLLERRNDDNVGPRRPANLVKGQKRP